MTNFIYLDTVETRYADRVRSDLEKNHDLWKMVSNMDYIDGDHNPSGFLPLIMGVKEDGKTIKDSDHLAVTPAYHEFGSVFNLLSLYGFESFSRCAFFMLPVGGVVESHIDDGDYYLNKDRFHLSLQGTYEYTVGDETKVIEKDTLFWFDNKKMHSAKNISSLNRITFVFDVPYEDSPMKQYRDKGYIK